ncbi:hypothetical protein FIU87_02240 [Bacillus sp. THAF10]|uniref:DUF4397 domain-containing protein n=1 Tax=Bacillus sp. THAF10 TaxID=2587848 RepID=UPI001269561B|nr:DUF4397 domain-containing protein [Bacillus sp. THAF10]QFT87458.1 hypothetical protein FIU87_02240 [Bacillus sp. THAF10]
MKKLLTILTVLLFVVGAAGNLVSANTGNKEEAQVRILHASPDAPAVDVYVDGQAAVQGAKFKDATDYLMLAAGPHKVDIFPAGKKDKAVISSELVVEGGKAYTVAAINKLDSLELVAIEDTREAPKGKSLVRVGHFSPDAPTVDVGIIGGNNVFSGASFKDVTVYQKLKPGTYDLEIRTPDKKQVLDLSGTKLDSDTVYSVFAVNTADQLEVLVLIDSKK